MGLRRTVIVLSVCVASGWGQATRSPAVKKAQNLYSDGCIMLPEAEPDPAACRKAFDYIRRVMRAEPRSLELSVMYASLETRYHLPDAEADAGKRLRAAIRARPAWDEPYLAIVELEGVAEEEKRDLLRQLIRRNPTSDRAIDRLITLLSALPESAGSNAAEIVRLFSLYRAVKGLEDSGFNYELERFAVARLLESGHAAEAAAILEPLVEFGLQSSHPVSTCVDLLTENPEDYRTQAEFYAKFENARKYCTDRDHEIAGTRLRLAGKLNEAAAELEQQIRANPYFLDTFPSLVEVYLALDRKDDAVRVFRGFMSSDATPTAKCGMLSAFASLSTPELERAQAGCGKPNRR